MLLYYIKKDGKYLADPETIVHEEYDESGLQESYSTRFSWTSDKNDAKTWCDINEVNSYLVKKRRVLKGAEVVKG